MPFTLTSEGRSFSNRNEQNSDSLVIEKQNLLSVFKLVIKDLLDSSLKRERILENEYFPLRHFFIVFEHILLHGYYGKKSFPLGTSSNRKDLWPVIELITRKSSDILMSDISISTKEMTNIRTSLGRVRAWLRLALMQKRLADYFKILIEQKQELNDLYDRQAIILSDENIIITGLLVGLDVLDFNFCLKEMVLDYPIESTIHYSLYLRERRLPPRNTHPPGAIGEPADESDDYSSLDTPSLTGLINETNDDTVIITSTNEVISMEENHSENSYDQRLSNILDQKNYLEEINRSLQKTVKNLQEHIVKLEQANKGFFHESSIQKARIEQLGGELTKVTAEKEQIQTAYQRKIDTLNADIEVERETYRNSRTGFDAMYNELQKKYEDEQTSKQKIENTYQTQLSEQTDRTNEENTRLKDKLQNETSRNDDQESQITSLGRENDMLRETIKELEKNLQQLNQKFQTLSNTNESLARTIAKLDTEKTCLETDFNLEKSSRQNLQAVLNSEKDKVATLQFDVHELTVVKQEYERYKKEVSQKSNDYEEKFREQERTIQELAMKLEASITREDQFRERDGLRSSPWMKDTNAKGCAQCQRDFNALRRKHHCRNCGQIYCEACASSKLPLASSNKPVRVCDTCRNHVLAQCAVNNS